MCSFNCSVVPRQVQFSHWVGAWVASCSGKRLETGPCHLGRTDMTTESVQRMVTILELGSGGHSHAYVGAIVRTAAAAGYRTELLTTAGVSASAQFGAHLQSLVSNGQVEVVELRDFGSVLGRLRALRRIHLKGSFLAQISGVPANQRDHLERDFVGQRAALVAQHSTFKERLDQMQIDAALSSGGAQLVQPARYRSSRSRRRRCARQCSLW